MEAPIIYMTVGISGSGKSHLANQLGDALSAVELNLDNYRRKLSGDVSNQDISFKAIKAQEKDLIANLAGGKNVILSNTHLKPSYVTNIQKMFPYNKIVLFYLEDSFNKQLCKDRIADDLENGLDRSNVPSKVVDEQYENFKNMVDHHFSGNVVRMLVDETGKMREI